jgi:predicted transcriptional regulator
MPLVRRGNVFQIRVSDEERRMLQVIAEEEGLSASDILRQFIRREWFRRYAELMPTKPRKK